jgi:hypothetical protein
MQHNKTTSLLNLKNKYHLNPHYSIKHYLTEKHLKCLLISVHNYNNLLLFVQTTNFSFQENNYKHREYGYFC